MTKKRRTRMICEIIRGLVIVSRVAEATQEIADKAGFSCDEAPCFRERDGEDDEREGMGCDVASCRRDDDEDDDDIEEEIVEVKAEVVKDPEPPKKTEPAKKAGSAKKTEPAKKAGSGKKTGPAKKEEKKEDKK
jgi:hypothetical protein